MKEIEKELSLIEPENRSCILLFSGGIDSTILLYLLKNFNFVINVLTINYADRNPKELEACKKIVSMTKPRNYIEISLDFMRESITLYQLNGNNMMKAILENLPSYYIPARNIIFLSIAAYYAEFLDSRFIFTGHVKEDVSILPDVNESFINKMNEILRFGTYAGREGKLKIMLPFAKLTKRDLVDLALKYNVPLEYTWSCHESFEKHCGKCRGCLERKYVFEIYNHKRNE